MPNSSEENQEQTRRETHQRIRAALNNAYAFVLGQQSVNSFAAFTLEDALDAQIARIEDPGTDIRPNELERVARILLEVEAAAADVADHTAEKVQEWEQANTPIEGGEG